MTCEKMLEHIQRQELFIHEEQRTKESTHIKVETREMLSSLKRTGLKQDIDPVNILTSLQKNTWLAPFATFLLKFTGIRTPEILKVRDEIKSVNGHIWQYVRLLFGKNSTIRKEAWQTIGTLRAEKRRLQLKMDGLIEQEKSRISPASDGDSSQTSIFKTSTGWIFGLYFLLYLISYPLTVKLLSIHIPPAFYFYHMTLPKYVMIFCFFSYAAAQTRHLFFPRHPWAHIVIYPFTYMTYLLILINLM